MRHIASHRLSLVVSICRVQKALPDSMGFVCFKAEQACMVVCLRLTCLCAIVSSSVLSELSSWTASHSLMWSSSTVLRRLPRKHGTCCALCSPTLAWTTSAPISATGAPVLLPSEPYSHYRPSRHYVRLFTTAPRFVLFGCALGIWSRAPSVVWFHSQ